MTRYTIEADGHSGLLDLDMVVGILITNDDSLESWEISEPAGKWTKDGTDHSQNMAEYLAVYRGLSFLEKKIRAEGGFGDIQQVKVITDSQFVYAHFNKETEIAKLC